jgi:hypothetical protein|tara:strand:- start:332 stop:571 length:240 start_codon:yes stop_codon:yes gene_type:complete
MSRIQVDNIFDKEGAGAPTFPAGVVVTGVSTATSFNGNLTGTASEATQAIAAKSGSALETSINGKTSPGKAIALSMVFG